MLHYVVEEWIVNILQASCELRFPLITSICQKLHIMCLFFSDISPLKYLLWHLEKCARCQVWAEHLSEIRPEKSPRSSALRIKSNHGKCLALVRLSFGTWIPWWEAHSACQPPGQWPLSAAHLIRLEGAEGLMGRLRSVHHWAFTSHLDQFGQ